MFDPDDADRCELQCQYSLTLETRAAASLDVPRADKGCSQAIALDGLDRTEFVYEGKKWAGLLRARTGLERT